MAPKISVVSIPYEKLVDPAADLSQEIIKVGLRNVVAPGRGLAKAAGVHQAGGANRQVLKLLSAAVLHAAGVQGFGLEGLGIVTVSGVPDYIQLREQLLPLAQEFAVSRSYCSTAAAAALCWPGDGSPGLWGHMPLPTAFSISM